MVKKTRYETADLKDTRTSACAPGKVLFRRVEYQTLPDGRCLKVVSREAVSRKQAARERTLRLRELSVRR